MFVKNLSDIHTTKNKKSMESNEIIAEISNDWRSVVQPFLTLLDEVACRGVSITITSIIQYRDQLILHIEGEINELVKDYSRWAVMANAIHESIKGDCDVLWLPDGDTHARFCINQ